MQHELLTAADFTSVSACKPLISSRMHFKNLISSTCTCQPDRPVRYSTEGGLRDIAPADFKASIKRALLFTLHVSQTCKDLSCAGSRATYCMKPTRTPTLSQPALSKEEAVGCVCWVMHA